MRCSVSAHALKGSASTFSARALVEAAWRWNRWADGPSLGGAAEALETLEKEATRLLQAPRAYAPSGQPRRAAEPSHRALRCASRLTVR